MINSFSDEYKTQWWLYISIGIRDLILGLSIGIFLGICFIFFPHRSHVGILCLLFFTIFYYYSFAIISFSLSLSLSIYLSIYLLLYFIYHC